MDEVYRRLPAILHMLMTLLSVPYVLLAMFFVGVGRVAAQHGPWAILDAFLNSLNWAFTWGIVTLGITLITICALGFFEPLRWWATLGLGAMILVTLYILLVYRTSFPTIGELVFLAPAILILATCAYKLTWLPWRR